MASESEEPVVLSLYRKVLAWNYYDLWSKLENGEGPIEHLSAVPATFRNAQEYIASFEPLMLEECCAVMLRGYEEAEMIQPQRCITGPSQMVDGFLVVQVMVEPGIARSFATTDVILLTKDDPNKEGLNEQLNALAVLEGHAGDRTISLRFYLDESAQSSPADKSRVMAVESGLQAQKRGFYITRLASIATIIREWQALHSVAAVNFCDILFSAQKRKDARPLASLKAPQAMEEAMNREYNESQMKALTGGLSGQEVVLIQGPPGTGKTKTLLGLLSIILHAAPEGSLGLKRLAAPRTHALTHADKARLLLKSAPWLSGAPNPRDEVKLWQGGSIAEVFGLLEVAKPLVIARDSSPKAHVLVCAPSNSALDEIVIRLLSAGVMDRKGNRYAPSIVRVGLQVHHSVQSVSLEAQVERRLSRMASAKSKEGPSRMERERVKLAVIEDANIVCSTLSFSGSALLRQLSRPFDVVVIDEAAQAVEPSTLIPLCTGAQQVYLIGDPVQLPATVISKRAVAFNYDVSLFKRLQSAGYPVHVLDTQYRMNPAISAFPSQEFYQGKVKDGPGVQPLTQRPWHAHKCFGPFAFYDVHGTETIPEGSSSLENHAEAELVFGIYITLISCYPQMKSSSDIAVISPYKAQVKLLRRKFKEALGSEMAKLVDINTIDGFQGREKEVAIFSAVRTKHHGNIGFVADERRINVGLTRARCSLLVIGNARALQTNARWRNLLRHARLNRCFYSPYKPYPDYLQSVMAGTEQARGPTQEDLQESAESRGEVLENDEEGIYSDDESVPTINPVLQGSVKSAPRKRNQSSGGNPRRKKARSETS